eukprot:Selendium_serpulae@DN5606_c1_g2_i1.p1
MGKALNATGRPIYYSLSVWGIHKPAIWAKGIGHSWRTTHDILGTDLRNVSAETKAIFLNKDVIALNQDPLGVQARLRTSVDHNQVWSGELSDGDFAVLVLSLRQPDRDKPATRRRVLDPLQNVSRAFSRVMGWMGLRNFGDTMVTVTSEEIRPQQIPWIRPQQI